MPLNKALYPIQVSPFNKDIYNLTQYLKLGDDQSPVQLDPYGDNGAFKIVGDCVWAKSEDVIDPSPSLVPCNPPEKSQQLFIENSI